MAGAGATLAGGGEARQDCGHDLCNIALHPQVLVGAVVALGPPPRPTVPSSSAATASLFAMLTASSAWALKTIDDERRVTRRLCMRENRLRSSSESPS